MKTNLMPLAPPPHPMHYLHPLSLRVPPLVVMLVAGVLGWISARPIITFGVEPGGRIWLAATLSLLGVASSLLGVASFRRVRTTVNPIQPGTATALVVSGIYRVTRNPMYLGFLFLLLAELAWLAHPIAFLAAPAFVLYINWFQIIPEERALRERFGPEYVSYTTRVRRWI